MTTVQLNRRGTYFDTYHVYDESGKRVGMIEEHNRGVKEQYFVGWRMKPNCSMNSGQTRSFKTQVEALEYAKSAYNPSDES